MALGVRSHPNPGPGKGTCEHFSPNLSFDVSFLWEVCPAPLPPQGERRVAWPSLGKFLRRPGPVAEPALRTMRSSLPCDSFATVWVNRGRPWGNFAPASALLPMHFWKHRPRTGPALGACNPSRGRWRNGPAVCRQVHACGRASWRRPSFPRDPDTYETRPCLGWGGSSNSLMPI